MRCVLVILIAALFAASSVLASESFAVPKDASAVLSQYCISCHGPKKQKGKVRFDTFSELSNEARLELLNKV